nr:DNA recombination/repair protein RecA [Lactococcus lactis]
MSEQLSKLVSKVNQTKPGGSALKFYSSVRIEVKSGEKLKMELILLVRKTRFIPSKIKCQLHIKSK